MGSFLQHAWHDKATGPSSCVGFSFLDWRSSISSNHLQCISLMQAAVTRSDKSAFTSECSLNFLFLLDFRDLLLLLLAYVSQISRPVEASQALVSSSRLTIPSLPDGGRCCGQTSKMWVSKILRLGLVKVFRDKRSQRVLALSA